MEQLNKNRSFSSCIREGYRLFQGNMRNIFVSTWKQLALTSVLFAALTWVAIYATETAWPTILLGMLFVEGMVLFKARVFDMIDYRPYLWNIRRMECVLGIALLVVLLFVGAAAGLRHLPLAGAAAWGTMAGTFIVLFVLTLPLLFVCFDLMMAERPKAWRAYKTGLRRWGFLFLSVLLSSLICVVVLGLLTAPLAMAVHSATANQAGMAAGDPSGVPAYFPYLLVGTAALTCYACLYVQTWQTFAMAFAYGSISFKKQESSTPLHTEKERTPLHTEKEEQQ